MVSLGVTVPSGLESWADIVSVTSSSAELDRRVAALTGRSTASSCLASNVEDRPDA